MNEQNQPNPARRRRRKPRRPKWAKNKFLYQIWRNWPLKLRRSFTWAPPAAL